VTAARAPVRSFLALLLIAAPAVARSEERLPTVAIDWAAIPDSLSARPCLRGLESRLLQTLVDARWAVIAERERADVVVELVARDGGIDFAARSARGSAARRVVLPKVCDETVQLELAYALQGAADELRATLVESATPAAPPPSEVGWRLHVDAGAVVPGLDFPSGLAGVTAVLPSLPAAVRFECSLRGGNGVFVVEPAVAGQLRLKLSHLPVPAHVGTEVAVLAHIASRDEGVVGHADGRLRIFAGAGWEGLRFELGPYVRAKPVVHRVGGRRVHESGRLGTTLAVTFGW
jgi:hypothetical protein